MPLFSDKDHPNTLAAVSGDPDHIWVLLHNLGEVRHNNVYSDTISKAPAWY
jgi:hypothetical protein